MVPRHSERSTIAACLAQLVGVAANEVPLGEGERSAWLAQRGRGLVAIEQPQDFAWPGPWIALRGEQRLAVVMFGVPSGPLFDPGDAANEPIVAGFVLAAHDLSLWDPPSTTTAGSGVVEAIVIAPGKEAPTQEVAEAKATPGHGLEGDRYANGDGTFDSGRPGSALTLIDAEVLDELGAIDHRRNLVVRGMDVRALIGHSFTVGQVRCFGQRPAEPCAHLDRLNGGSILRPLVHRAGLRADVLTEGTIRVGDAVTTLAD